MLLLQLFVSQPNHPGELTLGHPFGTQSLDYSLKGGSYPIKNWMLKIYTEFAGLGDCIFNIEHRAGFSGEKIHLCVLCDQYTEMPPF